MKIKPVDAESCSPATLNLEAAIQRIINAVNTVVTTEQCDIRNTVGRVVAADVIAAVDSPPFDNSAMDGYALNTAAFEIDSELLCVGKSYAGKPYTGEIKAGECIEIMTGAQVPSSVNSVVPVERTNAAGSTISFSGQVRENDNIRKQGEDIRAGEILIRCGHKIRPIDVALLVSCGVAEVSVYQPIDVAIISTGDELVEPGHTLKAGQIYDSNRHMIKGWLERLPVNVISAAVVKDEPEALIKAISDADISSDLIITTGGVSVGAADYVKEVMRNIGDIDFWKVKIKPGKPVAFGKLKQACFLGLPGNPVSAAICFEKFALPLIASLSGQKQYKSERLNATLNGDIKRKAGREEFLRGIVTYTSNGLIVTPCGGQGSAMLHAMASANAFIYLPADITAVQAGGVVEIELNPFVMQ